MYTMKDACVIEQCDFFAQHWDCNVMNFAIHLLNYAILRFLINITFNFFSSS